MALTKNNPKDKKVISWGTLKNERFQLCARTWWSSSYTAVHNLHSRLTNIDDKSSQWERGMKNVLTVTQTRNDPIFNPFRISQADVGIFLDTFGSFEECCLVALWFLKPAREKFSIRFWKEKADFWKIWHYLQTFDSFEECCLVALWFSKPAREEFDFDFFSKIWHCFVSIKYSFRIFPIYKVKKPFQSEEFLRVFVSIKVETWMSVTSHLN